MPSNGSPTPQEPQPSRGQQRISPSTKPHQLKNGLWNCPRCSATFAHKVIAVYHLNHEHDTRRALDFKEVIEVQPLPRQPHKVETIVKVEESKSEIKTSTTKRKVTAEILGPGGLITLREVDGKWPCPTGCGAIFGTVSSVSRHTNSTACYRVLQKVEQPKKPVRTTREPGRLPVSTRMQCRQLGISMESDITDPLGDISLQSKSISRPNLHIKTSSETTAPSSITPVESPSQISPTQTSSILTVQRDSANNITSITFLDKMDPRNPPLTKVYPPCRSGHTPRSRVRAARAVLLNEIHVSDPDPQAPTDSRLSLVSILLQNLNFTTIVDHLQRRYYAQAVSNRRLEDFRIRGIVAIHEYFGEPQPKTAQEGIVASRSKEEERKEASTENTKQSPTEKMQFLDAPEPEAKNVESSVVASHFDHGVKRPRRRTEDENEREAKRQQKDSSRTSSEPDDRRSPYPSPVSRERSQSRVDHDSTSDSSCVFQQLIIPAILNTIYNLHKEILRCKRLLQILQEHLLSVKLDDSKQRSREVYLRAEIDDMEDRLRNAKEQLAKEKELYKELIGENTSERETCEKV